MDRQRPAIEFARIGPGKGFLFVFMRLHALEVILHRSWPQHSPWFFRSSFNDV